MPAWLEPQSIGRYIGRQNGSSADETAWSTASLPMNFRYSVWSSVARLRRPDWASPRPQNADDVSHRSCDGVAILLTAFCLGKSLKCCGIYLAHDKRKIILFFSVFIKRRLLLHSSISRLNQTRNKYIQRLCGQITCFRSNLMLSSKQKLFRLSIPSSAKGPTTSGSRNFNSRNRSPLSSIRPINILQKLYSVGGIETCSKGRFNVITTTKSSCQFSKLQTSNNLLPFDFHVLELMAGIEVRL